MGAEVVLEEDDEVGCCFRGVLNGVICRDDGFAAPGKVAGPVGDDAVGAAGAVAASSVADDGVGGGAAYG